MERTQTRYIPLIVVLLLIVALALAYGPRFYRALKLNNACGAALANARDGKLSAMASYIEPAQQQAVTDLLNQLLPADYYKEIVSLKMTGSSAQKDNSAWVFVTCRTQGDNTGGIYQGKLLWRYVDGDWQWDFLGSYAAQATLGTAPQWESLESYVRLASQY